MEILVISRFFVARIVTKDIRTAVGFYCILYSRVMKELNLFVTKMHKTPLIFPNFKEDFEFLRKRPEGMFRIFVLLAILSKFYHKKVCKYFSHVSYWKFFTA